MHPSPILNCRLERWCAWSGGVVPAVDAMLAGGLWLAGDAPDVSFLAAMQRRRLSPLARAAFAVAWPCLEGSEAVPLVCSSAHGEMQRSVELLRTLAEAEPLSPMSFSLSVHNAIAGQLSIALDNRASVLALAPGEEGLAAALVEACGLLQEGADTVVVVWYDEPLPAPYRRFGEGEPGLPAALALRLGRGDHGVPLYLERRPDLERKPDTARKSDMERSRPSPGPAAAPGQPGQLAELLGWIASGATAEFSSSGNAARWNWRTAA